MSLARGPRAVVALAALATAASLVSCNHDDQQQLADQQALIAALAPDVGTIYVNFSCGTDTTFGLFYDAPGNQKKPAWAFMRHPSGPKNQISWEVQQNAQPVTITTIGDKPGQGSFPINVIQQGGSPGVAFKATVKPGAGGHGANSDTTYAYSIGVTCKPASGPDIHVVIDPEMIVRKP